MTKKPSEIIKEMMLEKGTSLKSRQIEAILDFLDLYVLSNDKDIFYIRQKLNDCEIREDTL